MPKRSRQTTVSPNSSVKCSLGSGASYLPPAEYKGSHVPKSYHQQPESLKGLSQLTESQLTQDFRPRLEALKHCNPFHITVWTLT